MPSSGASGSNETTRLGASGTWGLEHSTFNLGELCANHQNTDMDRDDDSVPPHQQEGQVHQGEHIHQGDEDDVFIQPPQVGVPYRQDDELSDQALFPEEEDVQDFTFSQRMSFGDAGQFSHLDPSASPQSDKNAGERRGSMDSRASITSRDMLDVPHGQSEY